MNVYYNKIKLNLIKITNYYNISLIVQIKIIIILNKNIFINFIVHMNLIKKIPTKIKKNNVIK